MADKTKIEWADATWNPIAGCTKISSGCQNCYAEKMAIRLNAMAEARGDQFNWAKYSKVLKFDYVSHFEPTAIGWNGEVDWSQNLLHKTSRGPGQWKKPRRVFVCSMSDLFHENVPFTVIMDIFTVMHREDQHTYMLLTKRPERALMFWNWMEKRFGNWMCGSHIWLGVTAETQADADYRISLLLTIPAKTRFVSIEPMLEDIFIEPYLLSQYEKASHDPQMFGNECRTDKLNWVICGAETGPRARPMAVSWAMNLRTQCRAWNAPFFFKKAGNRITTPAALDIQEFPKK